MFKFRLPLAGLIGIEPMNSASETDVIPFHHNPITTGVVYPAIFLPERPM